MTASTYTPEAIEKLVRAAERVRGYIPITNDGRDMYRDLASALRPFTTEPSSWESFVREMLGEGSIDGDRYWPNPATGDCYYLTETRAAYRARYGVEP